MKDKENTYFFAFDEKNRGKRVTKCPECSIGEVDPWKDCLSSCPSKKLEEEHKKVIHDMLKHECFSILEIEVKVIFLENIKSVLNYDKDKKQNLAWTEASLKNMYIPWYTLRSKYQFFDTIIHEMAHLTTFKQKYWSDERLTIEKYHHLEKSLFFNLSSKERENHCQNYYKENWEVLDKYNKEWKESKEGHWYDYWYSEYERLFWDFFHDPRFQKYTYDKISEPLSYGFDKEGKGEYKAEMVKYE